MSTPPPTPSTATGGTPPSSPIRPVAVIAGGSAGVGRATAELLARKGHDIAVLARGADNLQRAEAALSALGVNALGIVCDVSDEAQVRAAADRIVSELGEPDIWVNCAMLTVFGAFENLSDDDFRRVVDTTFMGQVTGTRIALEGMRRRGHGRIVCVGSGLSYRSVPLQSAYCASKAAINGFTQSVRSELIHDGLDGDRGITLSLVQLPAINTPQFDWARFEIARQPRPAAPVYQPELAARAVWQAIEKRSRELLVGKSVIGLVFGDMVFRAVFDRRLAKAGYEGQHSDRAPSGTRDDNLASPSSMSADARGSFGDEASDDGVIIDADLARALVFGGGAVVLVLIGLLFGLSLD